MKSLFPKNCNVVVIGGGTGSFNLLSALKYRTDNISAIVNMVDDGGSTGILRDELGVLPPGDVRQCLVALSESPDLRRLFNYRFEEGTFEGHPFGNILLSALEKVTGSFGEAVKTASEVLNIKGSVIPATLDNIRLKMEWPNASLILRGERVIGSDYFKYDPRKAVLSLIPSPKANPKAIAAIEAADMVVIAPGDLYTSIGPLLVIDGIAESLIKTKALCVYVSNLVTKHGQTENFTVGDHANEIERFVGSHFLDYVIYNKQVPIKDIAKLYEAESAFIVKSDESSSDNLGYRLISGNFLGKLAKKDKVSNFFPVNRSLIRHDSESIADALVKLVKKSELK